MRFCELSVKAMAFFAMACGVCGWSEPMSARNHVLMSYNVRNCIGMDRENDCQRVASVIAMQAPDMVAIQELGSVTARSKQCYVLGELAIATGMHPFYAPAIEYGGGKYGIGILTKEEPIGVERYPLPGREEPRAVIVVEFRDYFFACAHFSLTEADRVASTDVIRKLADEKRKPFFIAGDFNAEPKSAEITNLKQAFKVLSDTTQCTFPADEPNCTIDYVMVANVPKSLKVKSVEVVDEPLASDHRPIVVKVSF